MSRYVVAAKIKPGSTFEVSRILREGPPFDLEATQLERHYVFLAADEITMLFEGPHAEAEVKRLLHRPEVFAHMRSLAPHIVGTPQHPIELFAWQRGDLVERATASSLHEALRDRPLSHGDDSGGREPRP